MDIDRGNKNYYNCRGFGYLARNCRNRENRIGERRRLEYKWENNEQRWNIEGGNNNLNKERDLIVFD